MGGRGGSGRSIAAPAAPASTPAPAAPVAAPQSIETQIRSIYDSLARETGDWVNIADIRDALSSRSRAEVDAALRELEQRRDVNIVPQADERNLSQRTRDGGINIGNQVKHFIAMGI